MECWWVSESNMRGGGEGCFYLELDVEEWTSGGVVSMVDVTGGF